MLQNGDVFFVDNPIVIDVQMPCCRRCFCAEILFGCCDIGRRRVEIKRFAPSRPKRCVLCLQTDLISRHQSVCGVLCCQNQIGDIDHAVSVEVVSINFFLRQRRRAAEITFDSVDVVLSKHIRAVNHPPRENAFP